MNPYAETQSAPGHYYDSDYPWAENAVYPENFDEVVQFQGLLFDIKRYRELAAEIGGPILELCSGTGRVAIPLAQSGFDVTAVDNSQDLLEQCLRNMKRIDSTIEKRLELVEQDVTELHLKKKNYRLAIIAFNSLLVIPDFEKQMATLRSVASHLVSGGTLVLDIVSPLRLKIDGDPVVKPFFTRKNVHNGNTYTRFATMDAFDENHRQRLHGWYDEMDSKTSHVQRRHYSLHWRPIFRFEIEMMLKQAGFEIVKIEGGHQREIYTAQSPRMFIQAKFLERMK